MIKRLVAVVFLISVSGLLMAQEIKPIKLDELQGKIDAKATQVRVVNFWASWCGPCVKEMPYFQGLSDSGKAEVILVSLDFPEDIAKAQRLLEKKGIKIPGTYLLDEKNYDRYITAINAKWSGAIPATLFVDNNGNKYFYEQSFEKQELEDIVSKLNPK